MHATIHHQPLSPERFVLDRHTRLDYEKLRGELVSDYQPERSVEMLLVEIGSGNPTGGVV